LIPTIALRAFGRLASAAGLSHSPSHAERAREAALFDDLRPCVLVTVLQLEDADLVPVIRHLSRIFSKETRLTFVSDSMQLVTFQQNACFVDHLPSLEVMSTYRLSVDWAAYLRERYKLIVSKWQPVLVLTYGASVEDFARQAGSLAGKSAANP
jgi:hypothetical protein